MSLSLPSVPRSTGRAGWVAAPLWGTRALGIVLLRVPRWFGVLLAVAWMGTIHWLSSGEIPVKPRVPFAGFFNNLAHAPLYGLLALFWTIGLPRRKLPFPWARLEGRAIVAVLLVVVAYGALDELHQARVPERDGNPLDTLTDLVGAACVLVCARAAGEAGMGGPRFLRLLGLCLVVCGVAAGLSTLAGG